MSKVTKFFDIYGMKCNSCEIAVESEINKLDGIVNVEADHNNSMIIVTYENEICDDNKIKLAIKNSGFSSNNNMLIKIIILSILVISMFFLGNNPLFGLNTSFINIETSFVMLFILGFFSSFRCVGVCGGILLPHPINKYECDYNKKYCFKTTFIYNIGRLISYTIIGGIIGSIGSIFSSNVEAQNFIRFMAGIFLIISGFNIIGIKVFNNIKTPIFFNKSTCVNNHKNPFIIGYLSGFLPCISLQTMQLYALSSGSFILGAASMFIFSLGTFPMMILFAYFSSRVNKLLNEKIYKYVAILIILLGILMMKSNFYLI